MICNHFSVKNKNFEVVREEWKNENELVLFLKYFWVSLNNLTKEKMNYA